MKRIILPIDFFKAEIRKVKLILTLSENRQTVQMAHILMKQNKHKNLLKCLWWTKKGGFKCKDGIASKWINAFIFVNNHLFWDSPKRKHPINLVPGPIK